MYERTVQAGSVVNSTRPPAGERPVGRPAGLEIHHSVVVRIRADDERRPGERRADRLQVPVHLVDRGRDDLGQLVELHALADDECGLLGDVLHLDLVADVRGRRHELLLSFDDLLQRRQDLLGRGGQVGHLGSVAHELRARQHGIVRLEDLADLVECQLQEAQSLDRLGVRDLLDGEVAIAGLGVHIRRPKKPSSP